MDKSWFFIPGSKDKFLAKSTELKADIVIFDVEDSAVPKEKDEDREEIKPCSTDKTIPAKKYVRVNEVDSTFFIDDIRRRVNEGPDGFILPKTNSKDDIKILDYLITIFEKQNNMKLGQIKIVPLIETSAGILNA